LAWANNFITDLPKSQGDIGSHWIINQGFNATFSAQGQAIYNSLKSKTQFVSYDFAGHVSPPKAQRPTLSMATRLDSEVRLPRSNQRGNGLASDTNEFSSSPTNVIQVRPYSPWLASLNGHAR
jgi:hypothetical protein